MPVAYCTGMRCYADIGMWVGSDLTAESALVMRCHVTLCPKVAFGMSLTNLVAPPFLLYRRVRLSWRKPSSEKRMALKVKITLSRIKPLHLSL